MERRPVWIITPERIIDNFDLVTEGRRVGLLKEQNGSRIFFDLTDAKAEDLDFQITFPYIIKRV